MYLYIARPVHFALPILLRNVVTKGNAYTRGLFDIRVTVHADEQNALGDVIVDEVYERVVANKLNWVEWSGRAESEYGGRRGRFRAILIDRHLSFVHNFVEPGVI